MLAPSSAKSGSLSAKKRAESDADCGALEGGIEAGKDSASLVEAVES